MNEPNIELLFPTPVMFNTIERDYTKKELNAVKQHSKLIYNNTGNTTSLNNYILDEPEFEDLKKICLEHVNSYIKKIYKPKYEVEGYITQSWLNWTKPNQYHHVHEHPNSFISGVLYINAHATEDKIKFHHTQYRQLKIEPDTYDIYNSDTWWFNVKTGGIVLFPSSLTHSVETVVASDTRVSLAFNTFLKGTLGDNRQLTELKLNKE
jgi:uncharacterized protein (TIGR02466 family)